MLITLAKAAIAIGLSLVALGFLIGLGMILNAIKKLLRA